jgi:hypothetical protein
MPMLLGEQVGTALPQLAADGTTAQWGLVLPNGPVTPNEAPPPSSYYIVGGRPISPGVISFQTQATPLTAAQQQFADPQPSQGC